MHDLPVCILLLPLNNNEIILISDYIDKIKFVNQWSGDVEISETSTIYNLNIVIYKLTKIEKNDNGIFFVPVCPRPVPVLGHVLS